MLGVTHTWTVKQTRRQHGYANIVSMQQRVQLCTQAALTCVRVRPTAASCLAGGLQETKAKAGAREIGAAVVFWIQMCAHDTHDQWRCEDKLPEQEYVKESNTYHDDKHWYP